MKRFNPFKQFMSSKKEVHAVVDGVLTSMIPLAHLQLAGRWIGSPETRYYVFGNGVGYICLITLITISTNL